jgi:hypothetical protein
MIIKFRRDEKSTPAPSRKGSTFIRVIKFILTAKVSATEIIACTEKFTIITPEIR